MKMKKLSLLLALALLFVACDRKQKAKSINTDDVFSFSITQNDSKISNISANNGKILVLNFFTSTCGGCKEELPSFTKLSEELKKDVSFVGVLGEKIDKKSALKFLDKYKVSYPIINQAKSVKVLSDAVGGVFGVPVTVVYDKNGKLIQKFLGVVPASILKKAITNNL